MTPDDVLSLFRLCGALLEGHFRLSSGLHSGGYLQCALVLQHPQHAETLARALAERVRQLNAQTVLSPALGGIVIGQEVARALGLRAIFAERQDARSRSGVDSRSPWPSASSSSRTWSRRRDRLARPSKSRARQGVGRRRRGHHRSRRRAESTGPAVRAARSRAFRRTARTRMQGGAAGEAGIAGMKKRTLKLTLQHDGTDFVGWQRQPNGVSIQELIERALEPIEGTLLPSSAPAVRTRACTRSDRLPACSSNRRSMPRRFCAR